MIKNLDELRNALKNKNWSKIARETGVPYPTVHKVLSGKVTNPSYNIFIAIYEWSRKNG